ncbi:MAG: DUF4476 domain-containing protein [Bacteroidota bacterium]
MLQKYTIAIITLLNACILKSQSNSLVIFSAGGDPFLLSVDRARINTIAQSNVKSYDLQLGWHQVEIASIINNKEWKLNDSVLFVNEPKYSHKEFTYALVYNGKKLVLEFKSVSELSGPPAPPVPEAPKEKAPVVDNSIYGNLYKAHNNKPVFFNNYNTETKTCEVALNEKDMAYAIKLLKSINDDARQIGYVTDIVAFNCYTTSQLQELLLTFPSEIDRLNIAKPAYLHVSDKKNISQLYTVFKYQTIKDNYTTFIEEQENSVKQQKLQCIQAIDAKAFEGLYTKLKNSGYENEKLVATKRALVNVCLSTEQTKQITQLFTHDREKLECLKCAYIVIVDKDKAKDLAEQFQFSETKQEFLKFISK